MIPCNHDSHADYEKLIGPLREEARRLGYALGVHGTLVRDIDLVACPWTSQAVDARTLAESLRVVAERINGYAHNRDRDGARNKKHFDEGYAGGKPHGRRCWTFHLLPTFDGPYIDLSVMPREGDCIHDIAVRGKICVCTKCGYEYTYPEEP